MRRDSPCKNCPKRHLGCHAECEEYKKFQAYKEAYRAEIQKFLDYNDYLFDSINRAKYKPRHCKSKIWHNTKR